jgi:KEOPS complex subunit Cgi121
MEPVIRGYRADALDLRALLAALRGQPIQLVRADRVYGADHLRHAAALAARALAEGRARAVDLATETLVYAAGERQVQKALALLGLREDTRAIAAIAWDEGALDALATAQRWTRDDALLDGDERALDAFGVGEAERAMLPRARWGDLVLERVAFSDVLKA